MRPHDIVILLKIAVTKGPWMNKYLADSLRISQAEISYSLNRSDIARLIDATKQKVMRNALLEFVQCGLSYVFRAEKGLIARGIPTTFSAPVMDSSIVSSEALDWPHSSGSVRGEIHFSSLSQRCGSRIAG